MRIVLCRCGGTVWSPEGMAGLFSVLAPDMPVLPSDVVPTAPGVIAPDVDLFDECRIVLRIVLCRWGGTDWSLCAAAIPVASIIETPTMAMTRILNFPF